MALKHYVLGLFFVQKQIFRCEKHRLQSFGGMNTAEQLLIGTYSKFFGESLMLAYLQRSGFAHLFPFFDIYFEEKFAKTIPLSTDLLYNIMDKREQGKSRKKP